MEPNELPASDALPPALTPIYTMKEPNQSILLYQGDLEILIGEKIIQGTGIIELEWLPKPHIHFDFSNNDFYFFPNDVEARIGILDLEVVENIFISNFQSGNLGTRISGGLKSLVCQGLDAELSFITFHLPNFHDFVGFPKSSFSQNSTNHLVEKVVFEADGWSVTLEQLPKTEEQKKLLKSRGGYDITHIGKIERADKNKFLKNEVEDFLKGFTAFLSFVRGFRVSPVLLVGFDNTGTQISEEWVSGDISPHNSVQSWFPEADGGRFAEAFPGFLRWWQDWGESAQLTLYWYLESNKGSVESGIILEQAALELIAWVLLIEKQCLISKDGFDKLPASDKLRILLFRFDIPLKVPSHLVSFIRLANDNSWIDAPHAFTEVRNGLVHPKKRQKIVIAPLQARVEAWRLGLWYVELCLLRIFEYKGSYTNRCIMQHYFGQTEQVPWLISP